MEHPRTRRVRWAFWSMMIGFCVLILSELGLLCFSSSVRAWIEAQRLNAQAWRVVMATDASQESLQLALSDALRAVALTEGKSPAFLDTAAWAHFRLGEFEPALELLDGILSVEPQHQSSRELRQLIVGRKDIRASETRN